MSIQDKIDNYLNEDDTFEELLLEEDIDLEADVNLMHRMFEFITNLSPENLTEEQQIEFLDIIDEVADEPSGEEVNELFAAKRKKINRALRRKRKRLYRKTRVKVKMAARKFRRTAAYKAYKRLKKRKAKSGKTARGKRISKHI